MFNFFRSLWSRVRSYLAPRSNAQAPQLSETGAQLRRQLAYKLARQQECSHPALVQVMTETDMYLLCQHCQSSIYQNDPRFPQLFQEMIAAQEAFQRRFPSHMFNAPLTEQEEQIYAMPEDALKTTTERVLAGPDEYERLLNLPLADLKRLAAGA